VTVPPDLATNRSSTGLLYRVTVTTEKGAGNGVGCSVLKGTTDAFMLRPGNVYINQPPGAGRQQLVVGGGVPPYKLFPQSASDLNIATATLAGSVVTVTAAATAKFGGIRIAVQDSSPTPQTWSANVSVL